MCFGPSTLGAGANTRHEPRIQRLRCILFALYLQVRVTRNSDILTLDIDDGAHTTTTKMKGSLTVFEVPDEIYVGGVKEGTSPPRGIAHPDTELVSLQGCLTEVSYSIGGQASQSQILT